MKERSPIINIILDAVKKDMTEDAPLWIDTKITVNDIQFLYEECNKKSEFDPFNRRNHMYNTLKKGDASLIVKECEYGKVIAVLLNNEQEMCIPWELWGRILRMYGDKNGKGFRVFFLADDRIRTFPEKGDRIKPGNINGDKIKPENINGGYTYSCNTQSIVLYRAEDATRVLIHELMHSSCADNHKNSVDIIESETEAWAELIYIALISQGKPYIFNALLRRQSEWMRKQNKKIKKHFMKDPSSQEFPWRYTIGKEDVWKRWGILFESEENPKVKIGNSLRLTYPPDSNLKKRFNVLEKSTIL